jgi:hypothetical protein
MPSSWYGARDTEQEMQEEKYKKRNTEKDQRKQSKARIAEKNQYSSFNNS